MPSMTEARALTLLRERDANPASPHGDKLLHQLTAGRWGERRFRGGLELLVAPYAKLMDRADRTDSDAAAAAWARLAREATAYLALFERPECAAFVRQADIRSSVLPELLLRTLRTTLTPWPHLEVSGQRDLVIEMRFDLASAGLFTPRMQRVDVAVIRRTELHIDEEEVADFCLPLFAAEVKTNLDKNMLGGIEDSVAAIRRTFPSCRYFAVAEWADFAVKGQNYASSAIDEIVILRRQRRSEVRRPGAKARQIDATLLRDVVGAAREHVEQLHVGRTDLAERLPRGRLVRTP